jgi:long-chain acyl-CoA synthetase
MRSVIASLHNPLFGDLPLIEIFDEVGHVASSLTYADVAHKSAMLSALLSQLPQGHVGLAAANTAEWIIGDLALLQSGRTEVPVPLAFSGEQVSSFLGDTVFCLVDDAGEQAMNAWGLDIPTVHIGRATENTVSVTGQPRSTQHPLSPSCVDDPNADGRGGHDVVKIIHTSGTTGEPKGVRIRGAGLEEMISALEAISPGSFDRSVSLVPFSLLIEQITALYLPLKNGGVVSLLPGSEPLLGTRGSSAERSLRWLGIAKPTCIVVPPAVVSAMDRMASVLDAPITAIFQTETVPLIMAGGGPVDPDAIVRLGACGIAVHEGYGLSENSSVVCCNRPGHNAAGTVGTPLRHCQTIVDGNGQLLIRSSSLFAGYTNDDPTSCHVDDDGWLHTGDRAAIDAEGRVTILGRLKNVIITSHGRNVSPEWVEGRLRSVTGVRDAVIFGDGLERIVALLIVTPDVDRDQVRHDVATFAKSKLAETDRPDSCVVECDSDEFRSRYFTVTGRPRREELYDQVVSPALQAALPNIEP